MKVTRILWQHPDHSVRTQAFFPYLVMKLSLLLSQELPSPTKNSLARVQIQSSDPSEVTSDMELPLRSAKVSFANDKFNFHSASPATFVLSHIFSDCFLAHPT